MFKMINVKYFHKPLFNFMNESKSVNKLKFTKIDNAKASYPSRYFTELEKLGICKVYDDNNHITTLVSIPDVNPKDKDEFKDLLQQYTAKGFSSISKKYKDIDVMFDKDVDVHTRARVINYLALSQYKFGIHSDKKENKAKEKGDKQETKGEVKNDEADNDKENNEDKVDNKKPYTFNLIDTTDSDHIINKQILKSYATLESRELSNTRANVATTDYIFKYCQDLIKDLKGSKDKPSVGINFLKGKQLQENGFELIYNVGKAAEHPPYIICLEYYGNKNDKNISHAIVGKGLTFDTGGLCLKPSNSMDTMFYDKHGACSVISAFRALVSMNLQQNIICAIGLAENSIDSTSYRPSDILKSKNGITVEVGNTDAEGRLVLASTFTYIQEKYKPKVIIDLATLTGACKVALGGSLNGLFSNDDQLAEEIVKSGEDCDESLWRLPITNDHREEIKSKFADINNKGSTPYGGASHGAAFLEKFIDKNVKWAHIDLSAAYSSSAKGIYSAGTTGTGAQTIINYLQGLKH